MAAQISLLCILVTAGAGPVSEGGVSIRYLSPGSSGFVEQARFTLRTAKPGWTLESVTGGDKGMTLLAHYDSANRLVSARALLRRGDKPLEAIATITSNEAVVRTATLSPQMLKINGPLIVTSAPDWSDLFLLCRHYDPRGPAKQIFDGLWIHPEQKSQVLPFSIEREGVEELSREGKKVQVVRFRVVIRGPSSYLAWADREGELIKLTPLPFRPDRGLIRAGWEDCWEKLRP